MDKIRILGLGHPRTGTGFTSKTLKTFGLKVGHEELERDGIVAWQLVEKNGPWPWMLIFNKLTDVRPDFEYLIYNTRNPKTSIPSMIYSDDDHVFKKFDITSLEYRRKIGVPISNNRVEQAILSITTFDRMIESMNPDLTYRIEDEYKKLYDFVSTNINSNIRYTEPEKNVNARNKKGIETLSDEMELVRPFYRILINDYCDKHGYDRLFPEVGSRNIKKNFKKNVENPKVSMIMMSYLGDYPGARSNPIPKFKRAVDSFLQQSYQNSELIIVSDGCELTNQEYFKYFRNNPRVKLVKTKKSEFRWPGHKRQLGINKATGHWIGYLDSDDIIHPDHIKNIVSHIEPDTEALLNRSYAYVREVLEGKFVKIQAGKPFFVNKYGRRVSLDVYLDSIDDKSGYVMLNGNFYIFSERERKFEKHGTSRTFHRKDIPFEWEDRDERGEDILFSENIKKYLNYKKIDQGTYLVCHVPKGKYKFDI